MKLSIKQLRSLIQEATTSKITVTLDESDPNDYWFEFSDGTAQRWPRGHVTDPEGLRAAYELTANMPHQDMLLLTHINHARKTRAEQEEYIASRLRAKKGG